jgi:hypothetical protein
MVSSERLIAEIEGNSQVPASVQPEAVCPGCGGRATCPDEITVCPYGHDLIKSTGVAPSTGEGEREGK